MKKVIMAMRRHWDYDLQVGTFKLFRDSKMD